MIIVSSLHQDFLPSSWHIYKPTLVDFGILLGILRPFLHARAFLCQSAARDCHHGNENGSARIAAASPGRHLMNEPSRGVFSVLGVFDSAQLLMHAIPKVKEKVTARLEAYSPYPIHGIDKALGLRKSPIGGMVFVMGIIGAISGDWLRIVDKRRGLSADNGREALFFVGSLYPDHV